MAGRYILLIFNRIIPQSGLIAYEYCLCDNCATELGQKVIKDGYYRNHFRDNYKFKIGIEDGLRKCDRCEATKKYQ